jgi:hypothetical protein
MDSDALDPRDIPVLTEAVGEEAVGYTAQNARAMHAALVAETLNLADSLLHRATKDIEAILFERIRDELRALLPELVDRVLREHSLPRRTPDDDRSMEDPNHG